MYPTPLDPPEPKEPAWLESTEPDEADLELEDRNIIPAYAVEGEPT
jgi:hypothetical protein